MSSRAGSRVTRGVDRDVRFSIVLPVRDGAATLEATLESLEGQGPLHDLEIVAVDDGSVDRSSRVLDHFRERLPLRVLAPEESKGWVAATNRGLRSARGELICLLHQDDLWLPGRLTWLRKTFQPGANTVAAVSASRFVDSEGRSLGLWPLPGANRRRALLDPQCFLRALRVQNPLCIAAPCFRRDALPASGGLHEDLWYTADWAFWLEVLDTPRLVGTAEPTVAFRLHSDSQTLQRSADLGDLALQFERILEDFDPWTRRRAEVAVATNLSCFALLHGEKPPWRRLFGSILRAGPLSAATAFHDSGFVRRLLPRLRLLARTRGSLQGQAPGGRSDA